MPHGIHHFQHVTHCDASCRRRDRQCTARWSQARAPARRTSTHVCGRRACRRSSWRRRWSRSRLRRWPCSRRRSGSWSATRICEVARWLAQSHAIPSISNALLLQCPALCVMLALLPSVGQLCALLSAACGTPAACMSFSLHSHSSHNTQSKPQRCHPALPPLSRHPNL